MSGWLSLPDGNPGERYPGLLMIYEVFGLTEEMKRIARRLSENGYAVLIPDILNRPGPRAFCVLNAARTVLRGRGRELDDLAFAREFLESRPEVDPKRLGVMGFCLGGGFTVLLASSGYFRASAPFYADVPKAEGRLKGTCPTVASFGGKDKRLLPSAERLEKTLTHLGVPHDVKIYPDAGHGFMNEHSGFYAEKILPWLPVHLGYHEPSAEDSWKRLLDFFKAHLN